MQLVRSRRWMLTLAAGDIWSFGRAVTAFANGRNSQPKMH